MSNPQFTIDPEFEGLLPIPNEQELPVLRERILRDVFVHVIGFTAKLAPPKGTRVRHHIVSNPRRPGNTMAVDVEPILVPVMPGVSR